MCIRTRLSRVSLSGSQCDLCASVVRVFMGDLTTETQRSTEVTQRKIWGDRFFNFLPLIVLVSVLLVSTKNISAQSPSNHRYRFEVGGDFAIIKLGEQTAINKIPYCLGTNCKVITEPFSHETEPGLGGRFDYNFNRYLAAEAEMNFFPRDRLFEGGRKLEGLFGVKAGKRFAKFGVFGKARPGFLRESKGDFTPVNRICILPFPQPVGCSDPIAKTNFAFDLGAVIEYYPAAHVVIRFGAGDTIVRFGERRVVASVPFFNPSGGSPPAAIGLVDAPSETTHNFQGSIGVGFRF